MANENYMSAINAAGMLPEVLAPAVYEAQEASMFLGGQLIPIVNAPNGIAKVPFLAHNNVTVDQVSSETNADLETELVSVTDNTIVCDLFAVRTTVRDLGAIDPAEIGRTLGQAIAKKFDAHVFAQLDGSGDSSFDSVPMTVEDVIDGVADIRGNGEMGPVYGVFSPAEAMNLMKNVASTSFAGGDFQSEVLRSGALGQVAGATIFMSPQVTSGAGYLFSGDACRIAMQKNVDIEVARRAAAVGNDIVASLHAKCKLVDAERAIKLVNV